MLIYIIASLTLVIGFVFGLFLATWLAERKIRELEKELVQVADASRNWNRRWERLHNTLVHVRELAKTLKVVKLDAKGHFKGIESVATTLARQLKERGYDL